MKSLADFFSSDTFGFLLKIVSGLAAVGFGILGIGTKTREDDGRLTRNGKIALAGIIVAGLLAVGTSIYEFTTSQAKARAAQAQSEQLMLSVRRGIYPFKGITASFDIYFDPNVVGLSEYKARLNEELSLLQDCGTTTEVTCHTVNGKRVSYSIPSTSSLFPHSTTVARTILNNIYVNFLIAKHLPEKPASPLAYKYVGQFNISLLRHPPEEWLLYYDLAENRMSLQIRKIRVEDSDVVISNTYSLADFMPGVIAASADQSDDALCDSLGKLVRDCRHQVIEPLAKSLVVTGVALYFAYPKAISFDSSVTVDCGTQKYLAAFMFKDIDTDNRLGATADEVTAKEKADFCKAVNDPSFFNI